MMPHRPSQFFSDDVLRRREQLAREFRNAQAFRHVVVEGILDPQVADQIMAGPHQRAAKRWARSKPDGNRIAHRAPDGPHARGDLAQKGVQAAASLARQANFWVGFNVPDVYFSRSD